MEPKENNWKLTTMIIGAAAGIFAGLLAAYLFIQRAELNETKPKFSAGEGVKVGMGVLGVMKMIADLGAGKK